MKQAAFHEILNPTHNKYLDAEDYDAVEDFGTGHSAIRLKSSDQPVLVNESPDEVVKIIEQALN
jgi:hypothetical protein